MATPLPHKPVRGSRTGRPLMALLDLLGRRWLLRVLWELRDRTLSFRDLQEASGGISPTVLNTRLQEMREAGLVRPGAEGGYELSEQGRSLIEALQPLADWSSGWTPNDPED